MLQPCLEPNSSTICKIMFAVWFCFMKARSEFYFLYLWKEGKRLGGEYLGNQVLTSFPTPPLTLLYFHVYVLQGIN